MTEGVFMKICQITFPDWMQDRTRRKYMLTLTYHGYVKAMSQGRWRRYVKVKDFESDKL